MIAVVPPVATAGTSSLLPFALVSLAFGGLIGLSVLMILARHGDVSRRVGGYVTVSASQSARTRTLVERALGDKQARAVARSPVLDKLRVELDVAQIALTPERLIGLTIGATILVGGLLFVATRSIIGVLLAAAVPMAANMLVRIRAGRQRRQFSEQLPDNLQVIASAMRAGTTFVGALAAIVEDAPEPSRRELRRAVSDEALGIPLTESLGFVTERMKSEDFQQVATVASLQRDTGGNTAEVIELVSETIRERIELRRMVRGLTAQGRLAGGVLSLLPVGLLLIISLLNPGYTHPLFHTTLGIIALVIGITLSAVGSFLINRIVDIKV